MPPATVPDFAFETAALSRGLTVVVGVDEVGRGPLAGPVTAAAVRLLGRIPAGLADSKALTAVRREALFAEIMDCAEVCVAHASVEEIDTLNILRASHLAMERAIEINPEAANAAMDAYNIHNDDALVMAEFRSIINEKIQQDSQSVSGGAGEGGGEKPAGQPDPIEAEARRIADAAPSRTISLGTDANGEPVKMTVAEYLDAAKMEADQARKDVSLIQAAAECLMGNL